jgi:2-polyprenyl-3-methyl-5-hydroxy-6-metoxy-1,4-benzoquinol methylase
MLDNLPSVKRGVIAHNVLDSARTLGVSLLPLGENSRVLDIGCGWGTLSLPIAMSGATVFALDLAPLRARFTQLRAAQENLSNLIVLGGGDTQHLPMESSFFDFVILNGVLEWTAVSRECRPREEYLKFLREASRVLKPGGRVYIGIENRLSFQYFQGVPEDHIELRFIALLPRRLADRYALVRRGIRYRTHTLTLWGYKELLQESGFENPAFFYPHPDYRLPRMVVPLEDDNRISILVGASRQNGLRRLFALMLIKSGLFKLIAPSYLILAQKPG